MKKTLLFILVLICWSCEDEKVEEVDTTPTVNNSGYFVEIFGNGDNTDIGYFCQQTTDGGYIVIGTIKDPTTGGDHNVLLIKTDSLGYKEWNQIFEGSGGYSVNKGYTGQQTTDGGYVIIGKYYGDMNYDVWLIKTDSSGIEEWNQTFGTTDEWGNPIGEGGSSVQQTSDGGYIITGNSGSGVWLIKTDGNGNEEWNQTFFECDRGCLGNHVQQTTDGGFIIVGTSNHSSSSEVLLIKTYPNGNKEWTKTFGGGINQPLEDEGKFVQQTTDGGYIIVGIKEDKIYGSNDVDNVWLIKTDSEGNEEWNRYFLGNDDDIGYCVQQTFDGGFIVVGTTQSYGNGNRDVWLIKTYPNGNTEWEKTLGGWTDDFGYYVQQTFDGGFIITGRTRSLLNQTDDVLLIKTDPEGNTVSID